jgi:hypothetical protein
MAVVRLNPNRLLSWYHALDALAILVIASGTIPLHESWHKISLLAMGAKGNVENWGLFSHGWCGFTCSPGQFGWFCLAGGLGVFVTYIVLWLLIRKRLWLTGWVLLGVALQQLAYGIWEWRAA